MNTQSESSVGVRQYTLAGWLSILLAVFLLPKVGVDFLLRFVSPSPTGSDILRFIIAFHLAADLLGIYVLFMFRRLLNERHSFHRADRLITALMCCYAAGALTASAGLVMYQVTDIIVILWIISVLSSLISIVYATRLLKLDDNLSGLLKPYVYSTITGGACNATVVLGQFGSLILMVSFVFLGLILIRAESEPEYL